MEIFNLTLEGDEEEEDVEKDDGDDASIDLSQGSDIQKDQKDIEEDRLLEELLLQTKSQIFKEPRKTILRIKNSIETHSEKDRWNSVQKLLSFLAVNVDNPKKLINKTSKKIFF